MENGAIEVISYGNRPFYAWALPDKRLPSCHWVTMEWAVVLIRIDYETKRWKPVASWRYNQLLHGLLRQAAGNWGQPWIPTYIKDKLFLLAKGRPCMLEVDFNNWSLIPRAFLGEIEGDPASAPRAWREAVERQDRNPGAVPRAFSWADENENSQMDAAEIHNEHSKGRVLNHNAKGDYTSSLDYVQPNGWTDSGDHVINLINKDNLYIPIIHELHVHDKLVDRWPIGGWRRSKLAGFDREGRLHFSLSPSTYFPVDFFRNLLYSKR